MLKTKMHDNNFTQHLFRELSLDTYTYQLRAGNMIESWLKVFWKPDDFSPQDNTVSSEKIHVRVREKPPSLQIIHYPEGGMKAGMQRVSEKLFAEQKQTVIPVEEKDLTRETIIVTLEDATIEEILKAGLLSPQQLVSLIIAAQETHPKLFITIDRYLMGIEQHDGQKIPFHFIEGNDREIWEYLESTLVKF